MASLSKATRGSTHSFEAVFTGKTPYNINRSPVLTLTDPNGIQTVNVDPSSGIEILGSDTYRYRWPVPLDAVLTTDSTKWQADWQIITSDGQVDTWTETFDVIDAAITESSERKRTYFTIGGKGIRVMIRTQTLLNDIKLNVIHSTSDDYPVVTDAILGSNTYNIRLTIDGDTHVYYFDIPSTKPATSPASDYIVNDLAIGEYQVFWDIQETVTSEYNMLFQLLRVANRIWLNFIPSIRMLIDKLQKRAGTVQAYEDADVYEYLQQGLTIINSIHPTTSWTITQLPTNFYNFLVATTSVHALSAQHILESELQFSFSGQTISLDYDRTGNLESALSRYLDWINTHLTNSKMATYRRSFPTAIVAGRPASLSMRENRVVRMDYQSSEDLNRLLLTMGLL